MNVRKIINDCWAAGLQKPRQVIVATGFILLLAYVKFAAMPFLVPGTDWTRFPPYLALPTEGGFKFSSYFLLYVFLSINAVALFGLYLFALRSAGAAAGGPAGNPPHLRNGPVYGRSLVRVIVVFSVLFHLIMLATPFLLSTDIFDYIRHGRILAFYGENPLVIPATYFPHDPFFTAGGWVGTGSVYGSLHVYLMALLARVAGDSFTANFFIFKGFFIGLNLTNLWLIWKLARRLKPGLENKALVFYGWNPFILTFVVANAHNDILMLTLVLAGFLMYLEKRVVIGALFITLATLVKFITLPILLIYLALAIRQQEGLSRRLGLGAGILALCSAVSVLSYFPLWVGRETFYYLTTVGQKTNFTISMLIRDAAAGHIELSMSNTIVQGSLAGVLALYLLWHIAGVRHFGGMLSAAAGVAFLTPFALFWFQPWYLTLALGLIALRPHRLMLVAALAFSFSVTFFDSFWWNAPVSMDIQKPLRVLVVFGPPLALLAVLKGRESLPRAWSRLMAWTLEQQSTRARVLRRAGPDPAAINICDPTPLRLAVEISVLVTAAMVPMAVVIATSPQLRSLAELVLLKLRLLAG
ncbi:MAG: hypothetical protein IBX61_01790 [Thermoleophilia bacterium]|nr:hypothetical protein [Thermoleophilia bacterium]